MWCVVILPNNNSEMGSFIAVQTSHVLSIAPESIFRFLKVSIQGRCICVILFGTFWREGRLIPSVALSLAVQGARLSARAIDINMEGWADGNLHLGNDHWR